MEAVLNGDRLALTELVNRHHAPLLGYLYRHVGGDRPLAEDMVQEAFLRVLRQPTYHSGRPFKPWIYTIATNLVRDHFKAATVRLGLQRLDPQDVLLNLKDHAALPDEQVLDAETIGEVRAAISRLGEEHRAVVLLRFYQGFSLREISEIVQIPVGTVKSRLSTGVHRLRSMLAAEERGRI